MNVRIEYTATKDVNVENVAEWLQDAADDELKKGNIGYSDNLIEAAKVIEKLISLLEEQRELINDAVNAEVSKVNSRKAFAVCRLLERWTNENNCHPKKETVYYLERMEKIINEKVKKKYYCFSRYNENVREQRGCEKCMLSEECIKSTKRIEDVEVKKHECFGDFGNLKDYETCEACKQKSKYEF